MSRLDGFVALVTGGSRGLGAALARQLAAAGANVVITGRREQALWDAAAAIEQAAGGGQCMAVRGDVSCEQDVRQTVDQTMARFGRIDALVNNAAICRYGSFESMPVDEYDKIIDVNLKGPILASRAVLPIMRAQGRGDIVNIASQAGLSGMAGLALYCASKFALVGFSQSLGRELELENIRVSCICPGWMDTDMLGEFPQHVLPSRSELLSPDALAKLTVDLLLAPHDGTPSRVRRIARRLVGKFQRDQVPIFRSL